MSRPPCTHYDWDALMAAASIADAWGGADSEHKAQCARAFGCMVATLQPSVQHLAFHATAYFLDWGHRSQIWAQAELPPIRVARCAFE